MAIAPACSATVATLRIAASMSSSLSPPARRWMPARVVSTSLPRRGWSSDSAIDSASTAISRAVAKSRFASSARACMWRARARSDDGSSGISRSASAVYSRGSSRLSV